MHTNVSIFVLVLNAEKQVDQLSASRLIVVFEEAMLLQAVAHISNLKVSVMRDWAWRLKSLMMARFNPRFI